MTATNSARQIGIDAVRQSDSAALTIAQVAALLHISDRTVSRGIKDGIIPSVRLGRRVLIPREKLLAMFTEQTAGPTTLPETR